MSELQLSDVFKVLKDVVSIYGDVRDLLNAGSADSDTPQAVIDKLVAQVDALTAAVAADRLAPATREDLIAGFEAERAAVDALLADRTLSFVKRFPLRNRQPQLDAYLAILKDARTAWQANLVLIDELRACARGLAPLRADVVARKRLSQTLAASWAIATDLMKLAAKVGVLAL